MHRPRHDPRPFGFLGRIWPLWSRAGF